MEAVWENTNQRIQQDLENLLSRSPKLASINSRFITFFDHDSQLGFYLILDVKNREIKIELSLPDGHKFESKECASLVLNSLNRKNKYRPISSMLKANSRIFEKAIAQDLKTGRKMQLVESDLQSATKNYYWAESRLPLEFASMIDDFDLSYKYIQDNLFLRKPAADSKYNIIRQMYNIAADSIQEAQVSLVNIPRFDNKGTERLIIDILRATGMISTEDKISFEPYSYQKAAYLIEQSSDLLDNLNGLPRHLCAVVRSVYAAYVFGGLNYSGFRYTINDFSDREFKGLLNNQIEFPRATLVRLAEGDDPVMAADAFRALMKQSANFSELFGL